MAERAEASGIPSRPAEPPRAEVRCVGVKAPAIPLRSGILLLIGSGEGVNVRLKVPDVAAAHAAVLLDDTSCRVLNLATGGGTSINGVPVDRETALTDRDELRIGPFRFRLVNAAGPVEPARIPDEGAPTVGTSRP